MQLTTTRQTSPGAPAALYFSSCVSSAAVPSRWTRYALRDQRPIFLALRRSTFASIFANNSFGTRRVRATSPTSAEGFGAEAPLVRLALVGLLMGAVILAYCAAAITLIAARHQIHAIIVMASRYHHDIVDAIDCGLPEMRQWRAGDDSMGASKMKKHKATESWIVRSPCAPGAASGSIRTHAAAVERDDTMSPS